MYRQSEKNLLSSNISSTCPHNMVNFGPLSAEIVSLVWGTPANFNWFRVLAALLHGTPVVGDSQTAALNRGRHLYSLGRPSRWALAHSLVTHLFIFIAVYSLLESVADRALVMVALCNRKDHYIFAVWFLSFFFFPRLISAVGNWMFTILWHMMWP